MTTQEENDAAALEELRVELAQLQEAATKQGTTKRCIDGEYMVYLPYERALVPGHIYSEDGIREARISGSCEYHFDRMFDEDWTDPYTGEPGLNNDKRPQWLAEHTSEGELA